MSIRLGPNASVMAGALRTCTCAGPNAVNAGGKAAIIRPALASKPEQWSRSGCEAPREMPRLLNVDFSTGPVD